MPFTLLGAGLLWFGWFGFNAGSALAANGIAGARVHDDDARAGGHAGRLDAARHRCGRGKPTAVGAATAIVVGLVAITPAAGFIGPMSAIALGAHRGVPELLRPASGARRPSLDDSLDVVAAHGVGGTVGALLTGVFAQKALNGVADGLLFGNPGQLGHPGDRRRRGDRLQRRRQLRAAEGRSASSSRCAPTPTTRAIGLDVTQHGEEAYIH